MTLNRSRRSNSPCSMMVVYRKSPVMVKIMYCGEEITNQINWNGIGWEDNEMKNVSNYYFYHFFWCGRNKLDFSVRKYLDHHDQKFHGCGTRNFIFISFFYNILWWNQMTENLGARQRRVASCS